jgi:GST-like protein
VIELFGDRTGNCLRVSVAFEEAGIAYQTRHVSLSRGEHMLPAFLAMNPAGKVPTIVRTGDAPPLVLSQSTAIMLWAARHARHPIMPVEGSDAHAVAVERLLMIATDMVAFSQAAFMVHIAGERMAAQRLNDIVLSRLDWLETALAGGAYLAGDTFSLADIAGATFVAPYGEHAQWEKRPRLAEWFGRMSSREGFIKGMRAFG